MPLRATIFLGIAAALSACDDALGAGDDAGPDAATCSPLAPDASTLAANVPDPASGCVRDLACPEGQFCYATRESCVAPGAVQQSPGAGRGGRTDAGAACAPDWTPPATCDATSLAWSDSIDVSRSPSSLVESDTVLATDGKGTVVTAWASIALAPAHPSQKNAMAVSHDDGATFSPVAAPADAPQSASNDAVLAYDPSAGFVYGWESYANDFAGAQHVWLSTSADGESWAAAAKVDDAAKSDVLDYPWVAVHPITHRAWVTYAQQSAQPSERLAVADGAGGFSASTGLGDGTRGAFGDLAETAFDAKGDLYATWVELNAETDSGGVVSGSTANHVYFAHFGTASGAPARVGHDVSVSGHDAVTFDPPSLVVSPDGRTIDVVYAAGVEDAIHVRLASSADGGATWSQPIAVDDDDSCATHFHPTVVRDATGRVYVFWYDNRDGAGHFVYSVSTDGAAFAPARLVSAPTFPFDTFQYGTGWLGDYFQPAVTDRALYVLWSDGREADQSHAFFAKASLP